MLTPRVQLDASVDFGLISRRPEYQGGLGVSVFFEWCRAHLKPSFDSP